MIRSNYARQIRHLAFATSALATVTITAPALASSETDEVATSVDAAAADEGSTPEIVVTAARRRDESAQDVPVALSVVGSASLERRGDYTLGQIQQQVPSLQVFSFNPRNTNVNIRGLGSNVALTNDGLENGVGFYIDNVYYGRVGTSQFDLVDLDRIEVLRGPQGTLFGKNTTSGVINISSKKPSFAPEFSGEVSIGNYGYRQFRASGSAALVPDVVAVRLSGAITDRDGFLYNVTQKHEANNYYNASIRGQVLITPTSNLELRLIGDYSRQRQDFALTLFVDQHTTYADGTIIPNNFAVRAARFPSYTLPTFRPFDRLGEADSHYQANMAAYGFSGQLDWNLGGAKVTAITAYRWWDWDPANDGDGTSLPVITKAQQVNRQRQFSQEVRIASTGNGPVSYVAGVYYFWQIVRGYGATAYGPAAAMWNRAPASPIAQSVWDAALNGFEADSTSTPETKSLAAFGQLDWKLADSLTVTAGLRYTHEKKQGAFSQFWVAGNDLSALTVAEQAQANALRTQFNPVASYSTAFSNDNLSGLISLAWKVAPDALLYASYSRGNKSGGLNLTSLPAGISADVAPEKVDAFEMGFKTQFLDRRVTLNGALFWTEIGNYQTAITEQIPSTVAFRQYIANIPKVRSRGVEADLAVRASDHFGFDGSFAYADAVYANYTNAPQAVERLDLSPIQDLSGRQLPGVPKFTWSAGFHGDIPLGSHAFALTYSADWSHRSSFNTSSSNSVWAQVPGYGVANARIGLRSDDGRWDLSIWAKNLFNEDYFTTLSAANTGVISGQVGEPRTFGFTFRAKL